MNEPCNKILTNAFQIDYTNNIKYGVGESLNFKRTENNVSMFAVQKSFIIGKFF